MEMSEAFMINFKRKSKFIGQKHKGSENVADLKIKSSYGMQTSGILIQPTSVH